MRAMRKDEDYSGKATANFGGVCESGGCVLCPNGK